MLEFRLTYAGPVSTKAATAAEKQRLRGHFHRQLKQVWETDDKLRIWREQRTHLIDPRYGFNWLPMVTENPPLTCKIDVLLLRPGFPGGVIQLSDIDNRLKTIFDALRKPNEQSQCKGEDGKPAKPAEGEDPFFVLLSDDRLITQVSVEADQMLEPVFGNHQDARLVIRVRLETSSF